MDMTKRMKLVRTIDKMKNNPGFCKKLEVKDISYLKVGSKEALVSEACGRGPGNESHIKAF